MKNELLYGLDFESYLKLDCISKSLLTAIERSPGHLQHMKATPIHQTLAMVFGSAVDCLVFDGPEVFRSLYAVKPDGMNLSHKAGKDWKKEQGDREIVPANVSTCAEAIYHSEQAKQLLVDGHSQVSGTYQDEETGLWIRIRPDIYLPGNGMAVPILADLKTTGDADAEVWGKLAFNLRYHWQAAMYCDGLAAITGQPHDEFIFIVAEREPPHRVELYRVPLSILEQGRAEYRTALQMYKQCVDANSWPTSTGEIQDLEFPGWARR
jgi:hypothetical protein